MFSAVTSAFIIQIIPELQPDPTDLTNVLLLRILQQNTSFGGIDPLTPVSSTSTGVVRAHSILFVCLSVTLLVAFIAVLGKQWVLYYTRATTWGNIVDRGKEHQTKFVGVQKWGLRSVIDSLSVMLQIAFLLFGVALTIYLWELDVPAAEAVLAITSIGFTFYTCITLLATTFKDCPFRTPISFLLPNLLPWMKAFATFARVWLRRKATSLPLRILRVFKIFTRGKNPPDHAEEYPLSGSQYFTFSNPAFWREGTLFTSPIPKDIAASAGFWLLENSTDPPAVSAVAAVFSELQWPSHDRSTTTALIRLRDTYVECLRAPEFKETARLQALESAAAYYVLYHNRLIWSALNRSEIDVSWTPSDLLLDPDSDKWGGNDTFEHLLLTTDRPGSVTSMRFLSYIAPYWFCGDSDSAIKCRPSRLPTMYNLIEVLEKHQALDPATLTDCFLCVGAAMDFPLHPEDLVRVDKRYALLSHTLTLVLMRDSDYFGLTFKLVVEHIHRLILSRGRRRRNAKTALDILCTLVKKTAFPLIDPAWMRGLLKSAAGGNMDDETFAMFLRLSARREEDTAADVATQHGRGHVAAQGGEPGPQSPGEITPHDTVTLEHTLFIKILHNVRTRSKLEGIWQDEAVCGGLIAMKDIPRLGSFLADSDSLGVLFKVMEETQPIHVRKAAYDVVLAARYGWLRSPELCQTLEDLDFPRQLYGVVNETGHPDYQRSFLDMVETLSQYERWHSYLRGAMDIWLPFRHKAPGLVLWIITRIGKLWAPEYGSSNPPPFGDFLEKLVETQWQEVPGRPVVDLTADNLGPLAEVTKRLKQLVFTEINRRAVLAVVEGVIPALERRRDDGYEGPGEDVCYIVGELLEILRVPV